MNEVSCVLSERCEYFLIDPASGQCDGSKEAVKNCQVWKELDSRKRASIECSFDKIDRVVDTMEQQGYNLVYKTAILTFEKEE